MPVFPDAPIPFKNAEKYQTSYAAFEIVFKTLMMATEWHVRQGVGQDRTLKTVAISTLRLLHGTVSVKN